MTELRRALHAISPYLCERLVLYIPRQEDEPLEIIHGPYRGAIWVKDGTRLEYEVGTTKKSFVRGEADSLGQAVQCVWKYLKPLHGVDRPRLSA